MTTYPITIEPVSVRRNAFDEDTGFVIKCRTPEVSRWDRGNSYIDPSRVLYATQNGSFTERLTEAMIFPSHSNAVAWAKQSVKDNAGKDPNTWLLNHQSSVFKS